MQRVKEPPLACQPSPLTLPEWPCPLPEPRRVALRCLPIPTGGSLASQHWEKSAGLHCTGGTCMRVPISPPPSEIHPWGHGPSAPSMLCPCTCLGCNLNLLCARLGDWIGQRCPSALPSWPLPAECCQRSSFQPLEYHYWGILGMGRSWSSSTATMWQHWANFNPAAVPSECQHSVRLPE